jgi:uncharacterized protein
MITPVEMKLELPMSLSNGVVSTTFKVWEILTASRDGNLERVQQLLDECPELAYAQYNYTPPIHFAVREGHVQLVRCLLNKGALDPTYKTYPFGDTLLTIAKDRGYDEIANLLQQYLDDPLRHQFKGDNGEIHYNRSEAELEFQKAVDKGDIKKTTRLLEAHPEFVHDETFFWGEGIMMMPAKDANQELVKLLSDHGAKVPLISKWGRFYYFKHYHIAAFLMENGMDTQHKTWHHVTLLHDMAQEGNIEKASLLLQHGAAIDPLEEEYQSTPLGMAARWGHTEMVEFLLQQGADPNKSGAPWSTPLAWALQKGHKGIENTLRKAGAQLKHR